MNELELCPRGSVEYGIVALGWQWGVTKSAWPLKAPRRREKNMASCDAVRGGKPLVT